MCIATTDLCRQQAAHEMQDTAYTWHTDIACSAVPVPAGLFALPPPMEPEILLPATEEPPVLLIFVRGYKHQMAWAGRSIEVCVTLMQYLQVWSANCKGGMLNIIALSCNDLLILKRL